MTTPDAGDVFDAGEAEFGLLAPLLWNPMGAATVAEAGISAGERVLDVCCGAGSSAIPAARAVGAAGHVDAVAAPRTRAAHSGPAAAHLHSR